MTFGPPIFGTPIPIDSYETDVFSIGSEVGDAVLNPWSTAVANAEAIDIGDSTIWALAATGAVVAEAAASDIGDTIV